MTNPTPWFGHLRRAADLRLLLLLGACLGVLVALQRPQMLRERDVFRYVFVFDVTGSMNVADVTLDTHPSTRLGLARQAARDALAALPCGSEVGLALFTERRALLLITPVDVCRHYGVVAAMIEAVDWRLAWRARSEIARGLNSSLEMTAALTRPTRLVFFSDGHEAPPLHADFPVPVDPVADDVGGLIVGVGGDLAVPIPKFGPDGAPAGFWSADAVQQVDSYTLGRNTGGNEPLVGVESGNIAQRIAAGREHLSSLRAEYLRRLAREAGLDYYRLDDASGLARELTHPARADRVLAPTQMHGLTALLALLCLLGAVTGVRLLRRPLVLRGLSGGR